MTSEDICLLQAYVAAVLDYFCSMAADVKHYCRQHSTNKKVSRSTQIARQHCWNDL